MLEALLQIFRRNQQKALRRPVLFTFSFVQPLWWLLLFGPLFAGAVPPDVTLGCDYASFVTPGLSLLTALFGASQSGIPLLRDAQTGMLARMLHTPTSPAQLLLGKLASDVTRLMLLALGVLGLGALLGAHFAPRLSALPGALLAFVACTTLLACVSCCVAALSREPEGLGAYVHVVNMPLVFSSSLLLPKRALPSWLGWLASINPLSFAAEGLRALCLGLPEPSALSLTLLTLAALVSFGCASLALARARKERAS